MYALDTSLETVDPAETYLRLPALGAVPKGRGDSGETLALVREPHSAVSEAFRTLRTGLSLLGKPADRKTLLFTSAIPDEGKSFCSVNYAAALAQQGLRTLL